MVKFYYGLLVLGIAVVAIGAYQVGHAALIPLPYKTLLYAGGLVSVLGVFGVAVEKKNP